MKREENMNKIDIEELICNGNYYKQISCYSIFFFSAVGVFSAIMWKFGYSDTIILDIIIYGSIILIPFGYFLGIKKIYEVMVDITKIKKRNFYIIQKAIVDKVRVKETNTGYNDTYVVLENNDEVWISREKSREIQVGDICYIIYLENDSAPSAIYSKRKWILDEDLKCLIK